MNNKYVKRICSVFVVSLVAAGASNATTYSVTDLSANAPPGSWTIATGLNDQGTVVGFVETFGLHNYPMYQLAIFKNGDTQLFPDVSPSFDSRFEGLKINASEQIAGTRRYQTSFGGQVYYSAFLLSNGTLTDLGQIPGWARSAASGLNDLGQVAGYVATQNSWDAYLFNGTASTDIAPRGYRSSAARGINSLGQMVGRVDYYTQSRAFFYDPQTGATTILGNGSAAAINDSQIIVGTTGDDALDPFAARPALFDLSGNVRQISDCSGAANDVNVSGTVVGFMYCSSPGLSGAFVFDANDPSAQPVSLNSLIPPDSGLTIYNALGVNASGQIAGIATSNQGDGSHAVLLTPN